MTRSLQRQLSLMLSGAILLFGVIAATASFALAYAEAKEFQDDMLRQIAVLSAQATDLVTSQDPLPQVTINDPESRVQVLRLPGNTPPAWLPGNLFPGFHTLTAGAGKLRLFIHDTGTGLRTIVAQPTDSRDEIAMNSALRTLVPLLLLLPLLVWLIMRILGREFALIAHLSRRLDEQSAEHPQPVDDTGVPSEIAPFVQAINRLLERVVRLITQQRRFIADASHELRTPLTALSVQIQNLRHADSLQEMQQRIMPLQAGVERARRLTEQLLSLARTQAETDENTVVDVAHLVREVLADFQPRAGARQIDLGLEGEANFSLRASPESLRLILSNTLDNALNYTNEGGEITIRLWQKNNMAFIDVIDNGPGIPDAEIDRVFDAFYRPPSSSGTGSGLGLSIAREAANRLGGALRLFNRKSGSSGLVVRYQQKLMD